MEKSVLKFSTSQDDFNVWFTRCLAETTRVDPLLQRLPGFGGEDLWMNARTKLR